ncbi:glycosyltransferase [Fodinibius sediminis]|uniref:Glycosyltransferase involved in cell wall bisynthesis n=1 Tax=Fodinibius sediminis TaxID=1214077 RepID=A0A521D556_9BACT|nr:glycosyltransferase [Fodinibius sediminis]SMO66818.1 Glycosyltransferase involved in cell wall bisynthesis [Fodinibius sediminis]
MNQSPLVSAVVTTHNREELLPRALDSVAVQGYPRLELVVVDDGSRNEVRSVVKGYREVLPVQYIRNEHPRGACRARNQGIQAASGIFVAGLDDDDAWRKDRIAKLVEAYSDDWAFVTSDVRMMYRKGARVWRKPPSITLDDLLYSNYVGNQGLIKKERLLAVGCFDDTLAAAQDYDLWIRLAEKFGPVKNVREPLQDVYIEHGGERISNPHDQLRGYLAFYQKHKSKMNNRQRKYQLFNIRKATGKATSLLDLAGWVPPHRYWKEIKNWLAAKYFTN